MTSVTASDARIRFAEILSMVGYGKERVLIEKHNRPVAALVSIEELVLLDDLLTVAEEDDRFRDRLAALRATRNHREVVELVSNPSSETILTPASFATVADRVRYPRPATQALRGLMAADGD
ncbi:MAG: type II toxin-antitoxin system Phd/YefM family antitoxin [Coriobacteriia bacterium]|nr:type II toxin-antitoxin system Phd/YefM family antitoxin [Coriobacteriia bacterium]